MTDAQGATASWAKGLLRDPAAPRRPTFVELFFDLVFVLALALVSRTLARDVSPAGVFHAAVALMAVWWIWALAVMISNLYNRRNPALQAMTIATMLLTSLIATAIPDAFTDRGLVFAGAYVAIHLGRGVFFAAAIRDPQARRRGLRVLFWFCLSAVPWLAGALLTGPARGILWTVALLVDYAALALRFPVPHWEKVPPGHLAPTAEHLAERYHQFFAIALGDIILLGGLVFTDGEHSLIRTAAFLSAFVSALLLWRLYEHCAGHLLHQAISISPEPGRFAQSAPYTHLLMVAGVVATGASAELVIDRPGGHTPWGEVALILGGPAIFLLGRARFDYEVFGRVARPLLVGLVALLVLGPAMSLLPPLLVTVVVNLVLTTVAGCDTWRRRGTKSVPPAPPL